MPRVLAIMMCRPLSWNRLIILENMKYTASVSLCPKGKTASFLSGAQVPFKVSDPCACPSHGPPQVPTWAWKTWKSTVWVYSIFREVQKRALEHLELELQTVASYSVVLGIKPRSLGRTVSSLNCWVSFFNCMLSISTILILLVLSCWSLLKFLSVALNLPRIL